MDGVGLAIGAILPLAGVCAAFCLSLSRMKVLILAVRALASFEPAFTMTPFSGAWALANPSSLGVTNQML